MIYYFSGTGNTRWVAEQVSRACGLALRNVADCLDDVATPEGNLWTEGILGLAFPIYGWTIPKVAEALSRSAEYLLCICAPHLWRRYWAGA